LNHERTSALFDYFLTKTFIMQSFPFLKKFMFVALSMLLLVGIGCGNSDDDLSTDNSITQSLTNPSGWKVTWYWDKDKDETNDFSGYVFQFLDNGSFVATRNGSTVTGTWQVTSNDGSQRLVINSGSTTKPLSDLDDDWIITEKTDSRIKLKDDNSEHLEELFFEAL
jgi:hypothetical protein